MEDVFDIFGSVTISRRASREQLGVLYEAAGVVARGLDLKTTLDNILKLLALQFKFDLCVIRLLDEERMILTVRSQLGMTSEHLGESERDLTMDTYIGEAFLTNSIKVVNDTDFMEKPLTAQVIHREGIKAFAHAPITIEGQPIGVLSAFSRTAKGIFSDEFIELYRSLAGQIGVAWRNSQQTKAIIQAKEREKEMQIAKSIQMGLLPTSVPDIKGISLAGICVPARQVGGDYYDWLPRDKEGLDLIIADVSGHDVSSALIMAETRTFILARAREIQGAREMLTALNEFFYEDLGRAELFITMFYLKYNTGTHQLSFASAGHNLPLLWRAGTGKCDRLDAEGLILGIRKKVVFEEEKTSLERGDVLLLYTDGVTEAENSEGDFFGEERLCAVLAEHHELHPRQVIEHVLEEVRLFTGTRNFNDDVSMVIMRVDE
jgi:hypothetical protein